MLIFILKKCWYDKIASGEKKIEYREVKPYWASRFAKEFEFNQYSFCHIGDTLETITYFYPVKLRLGYTKKCMSALVYKIEIVDGKGTDLRIDAPVYAIHLCDVKEATQ